MVSQSAWAQVLEQMGYRKTLLLEIPVIAAVVSPELAAAATDLGKAQAAMQRGDYREAVGHCRDIMEQVRLALRDEGNATFENVREKNKADRLKLLRRSFTVFTHPARHRDDVTAVIDWTRIDAVFAISVAGAILTELAAPGAR